jgi:YidC/Oxa1 family membrane protein insertase
MLIRMLLVFAVYYLITQPLTHLLQLDAETVKSLTDMIGKDGGYYSELLVVTGVKEGTLNVAADLKASIEALNFNLFGLDLTQTPQWNWNVVAGWNPLWLIPIAAFASQMLTSVISMKMQKRTNPDAPSMAGMMLTMPLISLFIGFTVPAAVGFYWACSSLIGGLLQTAMQYFYSPQKMLATERAKEITAVYEAEQKYIKGRVANGDK